MYNIRSIEWKRQINAWIIYLTCEEYSSTIWLKDIWNEINITISFRNKFNIILKISKWIVRINKIVKYKFKLETKLIDFSK